MVSALLVLTRLLPVIRLATAVNVVVFLPGTTDDDRRLLSRLAQELAFRNHRVCAFRAIIVPEKKYLVQPHLHDVRELKLPTNISEDLYEAVRDQGNDVAFWDLDYDSSDRHLIPIWTARASACESVIDSDLMDRLRDELYDVAVVYAGNPCHLGVVHALAMPFIYFDTQGFTDEMVMASSSPWVPSLPLSSKTVLQNGFFFLNRLQQLWSLITEYSAFTNHTSTMQALSPRWSFMDAPVSKLFQENEELRKRYSVFPNVNEIKKTASAYFVNSDRVLELHGRPDVPNLVYVGGMHIEYPRPMFPPFSDTNALAKDGVILFSMGMVVNATQMPNWMKRAFLKAFAKFPRHRIYWRLGSPTLGDDIDESEIPKNINFTQFIPQNDLLAADETVLLISNGGANSIMEAVNYGVPVLGIPLYGVNYDNLKKLASKGAAIILHKEELSAKSIYRAMRKLLDDKYFMKAQFLSRVYKDRLTTALETAMHWVEYVGRHHGAKYKTLKKPNRLFFYEYLMLDVAALGLACVWVVLKLALLAWSLAKQLIKCRGNLKKSAAGGHSGATAADNTEFDELGNANMEECTENVGTRNGSRHKRSRSSTEDKAVKKSK